MEGRLQGEAMLRSEDAILKQHGRTDPHPALRLEGIWQNLTPKLRSQTALPASHKCPAVPPVLTRSGLLQFTETMPLCCFG